MVSFIFMLVLISPILTIQKGSSFHAKTEVKDITSPCTQVIYNFKNHQNNSKFPDFYNRKPS